MLHALLGLMLVTHPLAFSDALARAERAPAVQASREVSAERARYGKELSRLTANPVLSVQPGVRDMNTGGTGAEVYLGLSQRFNLGGLAGKRRDTVALEMAEDEASTRATRLTVRRTVAEAWLACWQAQEELRAAEQEGALARQLVAQLATLVQAGEATHVELEQARAWQAEAHVVELSARGRGFEAGMALSRALGSEQPQPEAVSDDLPSIDLPDLAVLAQRRDVLEGVAAVELARTTAQAERARLEEVHAARAPTMAVGAMGWREGGGDLAAVATLEVELPAFEHGERERSVQAAAVARAAHAARATELGARLDRTLALHDVEHTGELLEAIEHELLVAAEAMAGAEQKRFDAREATARDLVIARRAVLKARLDMLHARVAHVLARFVASELFTATEISP